MIKCQIADTEGKWHKIAETGNILKTQVDFLEGEI